MKLYRDRIGGAKRGTQKTTGCELSYVAAGRGQKSHQWFSLGFVLQTYAVAPVSSWPKKHNEETNDLAILVFVLSFKVSIFILALKYFSLCFSFNAKS